MQIFNFCKNVYGLAVKLDKLFNEKAKGDETPMEKGEPKPAPPVFQITSNGPTIRPSV